VCLLASYLPLGLALSRSKEPQWERRPGDELPRKQNELRHNPPPNAIPTTFSSFSRDLLNVTSIFLWQVVPLWRQKAGRDEEKLVIWDYHAIFLLIHEGAAGSGQPRKCLVFDLDSDLPFPTYFHKVGSDD